MALWKVQMKFDMVVLADSKEEAKLVIKEYAGEECGNQAHYLDLKPRKVTKVSDLPDEWDEALPWGDDDADRSCSDILEEA